MEKEAGLIMSKEEEEDTKLYQFGNKYGKIVKQFDELINVMDAATTKPPRPPRRQRRASSKKSSGESSSATAPAPAPVPSTQPEKFEAVGQTVSRFLNELKVDSTTGPDCSTSTRGQE